jgi:Fe-S cluster biogenesis protein NfuA
METPAEIPVIIYTESTPNPNTLKFVTNKAVLLNDFVEFQSIEETELAPLAAALFGFEGVTNVYISNNFVTVSKKEEMVWPEMMIPIKDFLRNYLDTKQTVLSEGFVKHTKIATNTIHEHDSEVEVRIKGALDKYVKPAVEMDGGNISFVKFEEGILTLQLQGSCSGCPSSVVTLKQGIENLLKRFVPEVQEVVAENA